MKDINETPISSEFETERERKLSHTEMENRIMEDSASLHSLNAESDKIQKKLDDEKRRAEELRREREAPKVIFNTD